MVEGQADAVVAEVGEQGEGVVEAEIGEAVGAVAEAEGVVTASASSTGAVAGSALGPLPVPLRSPSARGAAKYPEAGFVGVT
ncbi:hypothetical protein KJK32_37600 [Streptomyces sp. JCM17656]|nr:hypothetical protein KJK32_37600 [Streptomyces sp. JCM17656]